RQDRAAARRRLSRFRRDAGGDLRERNQTGCALRHHHAARHIVRENVMSLIVRDATLEDAEDILAIYNYAAINTTAVWTDGPADLESRRAVIRARQAAGHAVVGCTHG